MRRESIVIIWIGGLVLAAIVYGIGPDRFLDACLNAIDAIQDAFHNLVLNLGFKAYGLIRALAIGLYAVFAVLAVLSSQRGRHGIGALVCVTIASAILVWRPYDVFPAPLSRWVVVLLLVFCSAIVMSQRLLAPAVRRVAPWPPQVPPHIPPGRPL